MTMLVTGHVQVFLKAQGIRRDNGRELGAAREVGGYKPSVQQLAAVQSATGSSSEQTIIRGTAAGSL